jgi:hypothetical protein
MQLACRWDKIGMCDVGQKIYEQQTAKHASSIKEQVKKRKDETKCKERLYQRNIV